MARKIKKKQRRKDLLKGEDEFLTFSEKAAEWGAENWPILLIGVGVVALFFVVGLFIKSSVADSRTNAASRLNEAIAGYNNAVVRQVMSARSPEAPQFDARTAYENAAYRLKKYLDDHPDSEQSELVRLYLANAEIRFQLNRVMPDFTQARTNLEELSKLGKSDEMGHLARHNLGMTYYLEGKYDKALEIFEKLIAEGTPVARAANLVYAGRCHEKNGNFDRAIERYRLTLDSYSDIRITNGLDSKIAELRIKQKEQEEETSKNQTEKSGG